MKIFFLTEGTPLSPASRIRVFEYLDRFRGTESFERLEPHLASFTSEDYCRRIVAGERSGWLRRIQEKFYQLGALLRLLAGSLVCDVVFIQRVLLPVPLQEAIRLFNRSIVYDFDDAVYLGKPNRKARFASQVSLAARVIAVSRAARSEALSHGAREEKVSVLPSPVDCKAYRTKDYQDAEPQGRKQAGPINNIFTVGWIGSPATTPFLQAIWPQLACFAGSFPEVRFLFIGARRFETGELSDRTRFEPWSPAVEKELLCRLDVGLMPLEDNLWCRGKGGYKLIQYMAAGVACLASFVGANLEIVEEGRTGFFIRNQNEWGESLCRLLANRELTERLGRAGRERVEKLYDYSVTTPRFFALLEEAAKI
ncbi:MAG TPA: glycosyltransferase family 4 protein [archaeon]|nr:glycosyltransferase family 4 protein [archaeon]